MTTVNIKPIPYGFSTRRSPYPGAKDVWYLRLAVLPPIYCRRYNPVTDRLELRWWVCNWIIKNAAPGFTMRWGWAPL